MTATRSPAAYGLAIRLARREVVRRPWRTALVVLLVAFPVAGMTIAAVLLRTDHLSPQGEWTLENGRADVLIDSDPQADTGVRDLPAGSSVVREQSLFARGIRTTDGRKTRARVTDLSLDAQTTRDIIAIDRGRAPSAENEVLLTGNVAHDLGVDVGDTIPLERPSTREVVVTGIGHRRSSTDEPLIVVAPGTSLLGRAPVVAMLYVDLPDDLSATAAEAWLAKQDTDGPVEASPDLAGRQSNGQQDPVLWTWVIGAVVLTVVGIVIASAFAAGARRQLTTLGQLAANGGSPPMLRRMLFLQGTLTGIIGAIVGLCLGAVLLVAGHSWLHNLTHRDSGPYDVRLFDLLPIVLIGVAAATVAALVPARTTSRVPVLAALAGRRPLGRVPRWVTIGGLVAMASGLGLLGLAVVGANAGSSVNAGPGPNGGSDNTAVWAATAILGGVAILLGACAIAPAYVSVLDVVSRRIGGTWRFAARSLARQRTRTGGVVSAVCATSALAIAVSALVLGAIAPTNARQVDRTADVDVASVRMSANGDRMTPDESVIEEIRDAVPTVERIDLTSVDLDTDARDAGLADDALLRVYGLDEHELASLHAAGALWFGDDFPGASREIRDRTGQVVLRPAETLRDHDLGFLPRLIVTPETAEKLGFTTGPGPTVLRNPQRFTSDEVAALDDIRDEHDPPKIVRAEPGSTTPRAVTLINTYPPSNAPSPFVLETILSGVALIFALFVVAVSLALASAETREERDVLSVVGAAPTTMRRTSAQKAIILTVMGALLAIPVGFLPVVVFTRADGRDDPWLVFPWRTVGLLVLAVPLITAAVTGTASTIALRFRPVHVSTMTFD